MGEAHENMTRAEFLMDMINLKSIPIVDAGGKVLGVIKKPKVVQAMRKDKRGISVKSSMQKAECIHLGTTLSEIDHALETRSSRLIVVDDKKILVGIVTCTDVLDHRKYYLGLDDWHPGYS